MCAGAVRAKCARLDVQGLAIGIFRRPEILAAVVEPRRLGELAEPIEIAAADDPQLVAERRLNKRPAVRSEKAPKAEAPAAAKKAPTRAKADKVPAAKKQAAAKADKAKKSARK